MPRTQALGLGLALGTLLAAPPATAELQIRVSGLGYPASAAFDLHFARSDLELDYDDSDADGTLRLKRLGIAFFEPLTASSRLGLRLGRAGLSQSDRAATAGRDPLGWFAELEFDGAWPADGRLRAAFAAAWRYTAVDERDPVTDEEVELEWHTLQLRPALQLDLTPRLQLALGASAIAVDGSERTRGATRATIDFDAASGDGGFLELVHRPSRHDAITLRLRGGNPAGLYAAFEHRY